MNKDESLMKKIILVLMSAFLLLACDHVTVVDHVTPTKNLFSVWYDDARRVTFDLSGGQFGYAIILEITNTTYDGSCVTSITFNGNQNSGIYDVFNEGGYACYSTNHIPDHATGRYYQTLRTLTLTEDSPEPGKTIYLTNFTFLS